MITTNLKVAFRNLLKFKAYSLINIIGLGLGMAVSVLILIFVMHELSYDRFHSDHRRIFQVFSQIHIGENDMQLSAFSSEFGPATKAGNPHVKEYVRTMPSHTQALIKNPERPSETFYESHFTYADPSFLKVFSFKLKQGDPAHALDKPSGVVLTERIAKKYFGDADPMGKPLSFQNKHLLEVTGVLENPPSNSTLDFDFLVPTEAFPILNGIDKAKWAAGGNFNTYLVLDSPEAAANVEKVLNAAPKKETDFGEQIYSLHNLTDIHLGNNFHSNGNGRLIYIFGGVAVLILSLALFNYMSLTTARATLRAKEVGVRKVVGSGRGGLIRQFYTESVLVCALAFTTAIILVEVLRQPFYNLMDLKIDTAFLFSPQFLLFLGGLFCFTSFAAGSYPALVLSGFSPLDILKGQIFGNRKGTTVRKTFIVFQFAVSIALIVCSLVVKHQIGHMQTMKLGLNKDQVLAITVFETGANQLAALRDDVLRRAGVESASMAGNGLFKGYNINFIKNQTTKKDVGLVNITVDPFFVKTLGLQWKTAPDAGTLKNRKHILLNETAVKELGIQKNPLGKSFADLEEVGGVLQNFHFSSPQDGIKPMGLIVQADTAGFGKDMGANGIVYVRLDPKADIKGKVEMVRKMFAKHYPDRPFEYYFLDDAFNSTFQAEIRMSKMLSFSTALAIFIACLGLFGLVTFSAETRMKEIGIRKVLGASVASIVAMLSADFLKLITISIVIALPFAYYFMDKWLQDFTYRVNIPVWIYISASLGAIAIAIATVSYQSIKAALMNPVKSLRRD